MSPVQAFDGLMVLLCPPSTVDPDTATRAKTVAQRALKFWVQNQYIDFDESLINHVQQA